jgi:hypothetical protein
MVDKIGDRMPAKVAVLVGPSTGREAMRMPTCIQCKRQYEQSEWAQARVRNPRFCGPSCKARFHYLEDKAKRQAAKLTLAWDAEQQQSRRYASR